MLLHVLLKGGQWGCSRVCQKGEKVTGEGALRGRAVLPGTHGLTPDGRWGHPRLLFLICQRQ